MSLLTVRETGECLNFHPKTIYLFVKQGKISYVRLGKRIRFEKSALDEFIKNNSSKASPIPAFFPGCDLSLDGYDKIWLKGGRRGSMGKKTRWNYGFGSIYLRESKKGSRWYIDYWQEGKRTREAVKDARSRAEALLVLQRKIAENFDRTYNVKRKKESITFTELSGKYLSDYAKSKKRSWKTDKYYIEASPKSRITSMNEFFGDKLLDSISPHDIERYIKARLEEGVTEITVNRCLQILRRMFNLAMDWGFLAVNPLKNIKLFSEKNNLKERILTLEEERRLLGTSPEHMKPIIITALNSGLRRNELLNLVWANVDLEKKIIKVKRSKGGNPGCVNMNSLLFETLKELRLKDPAAEFVFWNPKTGKPFVEIGKAFRAACRRAGIKGFRFHDLRHTFASRLIEAGVDIITVRDLLGHSSVKLTERYTHSKNEQKKRAVELLAQEKPENVSQNWHKFYAEENRVKAIPLFSVN